MSCWASQGIPENDLITITEIERPAVQYRIAVLIQRESAGRTPTLFSLYRRAAACGLDPMALYRSMASIALADRVSRRVFQGMYHKGHPFRKIFTVSLHVGFSESNGGLSEQHSGR